MNIPNILKHFNTITKHRHLVIRYAFKAGIPFLGLRHDLSKYTPTEFFAGVRYYQGTRSPNEVEREKFGYSPAWMHHKGRNRHHYEYWYDYNPKLKKNMPVKMPRKYVVEMFCDRLAASKIYRGKNYSPKYPLEYFLREKEHMQIHPETAAEIEKLLKIVAEQGENAAFNYIRNKFK